jgi:hypothetical protein
LKSGKINICDTSIKGPFLRVHILTFFFKDQILNKNIIVNTISHFYTLIYKDRYRSINYNCVIRIYFKDTPDFVSFNTQIEYGNRFCVLKDFLEYLYRFEESYITTLEVRSIEFQYYKVEGNSSKI